MDSYLIVFVVLPRVDRCWIPSQNTVRTFKKKNVGHEWDPVWTPQNNAWHVVWWCNYYMLVPGKSFQRHRSLSSFFMVRKAFVSSAASRPMLMATQTWHNSQKMQPFAEHENKNVGTLHIGVWHAGSGCNSSAFVCHMLSKPKRLTHLALDAQLAQLNTVHTMQLFHAIGAVDRLATRRKVDTVELGQPVRCIYVFNCIQWCQMWQHCSIVSSVSSVRPGSTVSTVSIVSTVSTVSRVKCVNCVNCVLRFFRPILPMHSPFVTKV